MSDLRNHIFNHRKDFEDGSLDDETLQQDPMLQFELWLDEAIELKAVEPYALCLSTIGLDGFPSSRIVYLRGFSNDGLTFYTNYTSLKGAEIEQDEKAAMNFFWNELHRQVRIKGSIQRMPEHDSDLYFSKRPRASQMGAWASDQSQALISRSELETRLAALEAKYEGQEIPRPPHWGGYILKPVSWEFWKGRASRLHDRFRYELKDESWSITRLNP